MFGNWKNITKKEEINPEEVKMERRQIDSGPHSSLNK